MVTLLQMKNGRGIPKADGSVGLVPLTHRTIAEFAGTTREVVTLEMNCLRRIGLIQYSRKLIEIILKPSWRPYGRKELPYLRGHHKESHIQG